MSLASHIAWRQSCCSSLLGALVWSFLASAACSYDLPEPLPLTSEPLPGVPPDDAGDLPVDPSPSPDSQAGGAGGLDCEGPEPGPGCEPPCSAESCVIPHAIAQCDNDGQCRFVECEAGFVDCDGDETNGCEEDFRGVDDNTMIAAAELLEKEDLPATAGGDIWALHPRYRIATPCTNCDPADSALPPAGPTDPLGRPAPTDLQVVFQAGWSTAGLHFRIKVFDDDPFSATDVDPRHQDNLELVYFGLPPDQVESPGADNHQLYVSFTGRTASATSKAYDDLIALETAVTPNGCRVSDLRLTPNFLSGLDGPAQGLTPKLGHVYTFNLGINDFDRPTDAPNDAGVAREWQHHLFHKDPQNEYWFKATNVGEMILEGPATDAN